MAALGLIFPRGLVRAQDKPVPRVGVASEGIHSPRWVSDFNLFTLHPTLGLTPTEVDAKLSKAWLRLSGQLDAPIYAVIKTDASDPSLAFADLNIEHPDNHWDRGPRACTEGQGWTMMLAVQADDQAMFNKLWRFTRKYLQYIRVTGDMKRGYLFCWQCLPQPKGGVLYKNGNDITRDGVAPDGDQWITAALYGAHGRWGSGAEELNYLVEANQIANSMLNVESESGMGRQLVTNLFQNNQVCYIPGDFKKGPTLKASELSDPSYCLPAFYQYFATVGDPANKEKWEQIAANARTNYLPCALGNKENPVSGNSKTGIAPYITTLEGIGYNCLASDGEGADSGIQTNGDGIRVPANMALDYMWWANGSGAFNWYRSYANKLLTAYDHPIIFNPFIKNNGFGNVWSFPYDYKRYTYGHAFCNGKDVNYINWEKAGSDKANPPGSGNHNEAETGCLAPVARLSDLHLSWNFVEELWGANQPRNTGSRATSTWGSRYWDGILYTLGLFNTAGAFKPYGVTASAGTAESVTPESRP